MCFCTVETHHPDRVLCQFGLVRQQPRVVTYDSRLHGIDLRGKVDKNWRQEHALYIQQLDNRGQHIHNAPPYTGDMRQEEEYLNWYSPRTRKYIDRNSAKLEMMIKVQQWQLQLLQPGTEAYELGQWVLRAVVDLDGDAAANEQPNNGEENEATDDPGPSTSASFEIPPPTPLASPSFEVPPPMPPTSTPTQVPPPMPPTSTPTQVPPHSPHAHSQPQMTPPSFDLGIDFSLTPITHPATSSDAPTSSSASALAMDPPHIQPMIMIPTPSSYTGPHDPPTMPVPHRATPTSSSADPVGPPVVGSDTQHPATDVLDDDPPQQPLPQRGRPRRVRIARGCGTGGRLDDHQGGCTHAPPPPPPRRYQTRQKKRKFD